MFLGDQLYNLTRQDFRQGPVIQRYIRRMLTTAAAVTVNNTDNAIPLDKVFVLTNVVLFNLAGAAQTTTGSLFRIRDSAGNILVTLGRQSRAAVQEWTDSYNDLEIMVMPGEQLESSTFFNAGAAANTAEFNVHGFFIPKGTLQLR